MRNSLVVIGLGAAMFGCFLLNRTDLPGEITSSAVYPPSSDLPATRAVNQRPPQSLDEEAPPARAAAVGRVEDYTLSEYRRRLTNRVGSNEAEFMVSVARVSHDWSAASAAIRQRERETGQDYGPLLIKVGLSSGGISATEIVELIDRGTPLPDDTFDWLAYTGNAEALVNLARRGLLLDVGRENAVTGKNAIGSYIDRIGHFPAGVTTEAAVDAIDSLISVGVDPTPALTSAITGINPSNYPLKLAIAKSLVHAGVLPTAEHRSLVHSMADRSFKSEFVALVD